jgi:dolichol-phosphate mannosyltransferase
LCTYNERENLSGLIPEIHAVAPHADILVVDDNSPDGTSDFVRELAPTDSRIQLISRGERGLGTATVAAFRFAIENSYDLLLNLDADFSHPPRFIPNLLAAMPRADVVIGSRYVTGGQTPGWGLKRKLMSRAINTYARLLLRLPTRDNSGAFRCYRVARLRELPLDRFRAKGYAFQEEILFRLRRNGCTFVEVPITLEERRFGRTKINWREVIAALWIIAVLPWERPITPKEPAAVRPQ